MLMSLGWLKPLNTLTCGNFVTPVKATYYNGRECKGAPIARAEYPMLNMVLDHEAPEKGVPVYDFSARFETEVRFEHDTQLFVSCDDGATVWVDGEKVFEDKTLHSAMRFPLNVVEGGRTHKVVIEYFQAGGEASIGLFCKELEQGDKVPVYLPAGRWLDAFDGKVYMGDKTIRKSYGLREMPLFVRLGSLIPLAYEAKNDLLLSALLNLLAQGAVIAAVLWLSTRTDKTFFDLLKDAFGAPAAKIVYGALAAFLLFSALLPMLEQRAFVMQVLYENAPSVLSYAPFFAVSVFACMKGFKTIGRAADIALAAQRLTK